MKARYFLTLALASTIGLLAQDPTPLLTRAEPELLTVLQSPTASLKDKFDACRELGVVGSKNSVPILAKLLPDPELSHMARYAMETLPDPSVDKALRDALDTLTGRELLGVINSLGARRDSGAVNALAGRLTHSDAAVAQASARALGRIGSAAAGKALLKALPSTAAPNRLALHEGAFRCAEALVTSGNNRAALDIFQALHTLPDADHQVRAGAVRGLILNQTRTQGLELLRTSLSNPDYVAAAAAVRATQEMAGPDVTTALATNLGGLTADRQILVMQTLGERGDIVALPALRTAARHDDGSVRLAAVQALAGMKEPEVVPVLVELTEAPDSTVAEASRESLAALPFPGVDDTITAMLNSTDDNRRLLALELVGRRRMQSALPLLLKATRDENARIRSAAFRRVGELGSQAEVAELLRRLTQAETPRDRDALEQALTAIASRSDTPEPIGKVAIAAFPDAQPPAQMALIRLLGVVGGAQALQVVRNAADSSNPEVHTAALRTLSTWKSEDAAPELLALAKSANDSTDRILCLRGYLGWVRNTDLPLERRIAMSRDAAPLINSDEEKKLFLGAAGSLRSVEALPLVAPHLANEPTKDEAAAAVLTIAEALLKAPTEAAAATALRDALQKAVDAAPSGDLPGRLQKQLDEAKSRAANG